MLDETIIRALLARASVVANETEDSANDANRIGTLFADVIRALNMSLSEEEIAGLIARYGRQLFLSKVNADIAAGRITMADGVQLGSSFAGGLTGHGGLLSGDGRGEMRSLRLWEWLEVPELRYNRAEVLVGDEWQAPGGGIIESVDTENRTFTLKLEPGEIGMIAQNDLCMGYWHSSDPSQNSSDNYDDSKNNRRMAGFYTCYFRITGVSGQDNATAEYELRAASDAYPTPIHPAAGMHFVAFGNTNNTDRQAGCYRTRTYTRYVKDVTTWTFTAQNIAMQWGDLSNLSLLGLDMQGYSAYLSNIYLSGHIEDVEVNGAHIDLQLLNGGWVDTQTAEVVTFTARDGLGRDITNQYTGFRLIRESGDAAADATWNAAHASVISPVTLTRNDMGAYWHARRTLFTLESTGGVQAVQRGFAIGVRDVQELHIEFVASRPVVYVDDVDVAVEARLFYGEEDVTQELLLANTTATGWTRDSGVAPEDAAWTPTLGTTRNILLIEHGHNHARQDCGSQWNERLHCEYEFQAVIATGLNERLSVAASLPIGI